MLPAMQQITHDGVRSVAAATGRNSPAQPGRTPLRNFTALLYPSKAISLVSL
jgi:hypothetical protein